MLNFNNYLRTVEEQRVATAMSSYSNGTTSGNTLSLLYAWKINQ